MNGSETDETQDRTRAERPEMENRFDELAS